MKHIADSTGAIIEQIDIDLVLNLFLEEFISKKKKTQKTMVKMFVKQYQEQEGIFSFEEIKTICKNV